MDAYINREVIAGFSVMRHVTAKEEWCAEAYLTTDYALLTEEDYLETVKDFFLFNMKSIDKIGEDQEEEEA